MVVEWAQGRVVLPKAVGLGCGFAESQEWNV